MSQSHVDGAGVDVKKNNKNSEFKIVTITLNIIEIKIDDGD